MTNGTEALSVVPKDPTRPFPKDDDPTDEVPAFVRLYRRHAAPVGPDVTIEEEIEREGIEDADPFMSLHAVKPPEPAPLEELPATAIEAVPTEAAPVKAVAPPPAGIKVRLKSPRR